MKHALVFLIIQLSLNTHAQFAIIADQDGYVNVRADKGTGSKITDMLKNGHLIFCFEDTGNWTNIDYSRNDKKLNGFVYKDRYTLISSYRSIPVVKERTNAVTLSKDSIEVIITQKSFDKRQHKFSYCKEAKDQIELIDNKAYWGTDGGIPAFEYSSVAIKIGRKTFQLSQPALSNLFEPNLYNTAVNFDTDNNILYIQSMNSDGAGAYHVIWKIEKGIYKERYIAYGF
ncbi:MAG: hypothetical protein KF862_21160 [Chitinophagaceae bacterium]|nr:hypothetical protein [Chitinophagaceae bacterium]